MPHFQPFRIEHGTVPEVLGHSTQWYEWASRSSCIARDELWIATIINEGLSAFLTVPDRGVFAYYVDEKSFLSTLGATETRLRKTWARHLHEYPVRRRVVVNSVQNLVRALPSNDHRLIARRYRDVLDAGDSAWGPYMWGAWAVIYVTEPELAKVIPEHLGTVLALDKPITFLKMQRDLFRRPLRDVVRKYGWIHVYSPHDPPFTVANLAKMKRETNRAEVEAIFENFSKAHRKFFALLASTHDPLVRRRMEMVHTYAFLKTDRIDVWAWMFAHMRPFYQWVAENMDVPIRQIAEFYTTEVLAWLQDGSLPTQREREQRVAHQWVSLYRSGRVTAVPGAAAARQINHLLAVGKRGTVAVHGMSASVGKARGVVRIIHTKEDLASVRRGDVFVARFTFPSYTPAMRKCVAIVTDDGGLTSHAAVVAREFKIPCIVGTGHATRVFKTGDRVEVDATKGIVKKL